MNILEEFLEQMASAIIFLQGRQPHKDCLWWLRLQPAWQKQQEPYFISPLTSDYGRIISNSLILYGQNLIPNQDRYLLIEKSWTRDMQWQNFCWECNRKSPHNLFGPSAKIGQNICDIFEKSLYQVSALTPTCLRWKWRPDPNLFCARNTCSIALQFIGKANQHF